MACIKKKVLGFVATEYVSFFKMWPQGVLVENTGLLTQT